MKKFLGLLWEYKFCAFAFLIVIGYYGWFWLYFSQQTKSIADLLTGIIFSIMILILPLSGLQFDFIAQLSKRVK